MLHSEVIVPPTISKTTYEYRSEIWLGFLRNLEHKISLLVTHTDDLGVPHALIIFVYPNDVQHTGSTKVHLIFMRLMSGVVCQWWR